MDVIARKADPYVSNLDLRELLMMFVGASTHFRSLIH